MKRKSWLALLMAGIILFGCAGPATDTVVPTRSTPPADLSEVEETLSQMRANWQAQDLADYEFQFTWKCFCPPEYREPVQITVAAGEIKSVQAVDATADVTLPDRSEYRTIGELHDLIQTAVEQGAYEIRVEYDEERGYPRSAYIDYERNVVDEERGFTVSDLMVGPLERTSLTATTTELLTTTMTASAGGERFGNANVLQVRAVRDTDDSWTFYVTVKHPDVGWEDYADGWDAVTPDGTILKPDPDSQFTRTLLHPHVNEQPFTRSQSGIEIPAGVTEVRVRAHDLVDGFGGQEIVVDLTTASGPGFEVQQQ